ncbi:MAG: hypothetical protein J1F63_06970 [Oscillospiraceae bacterium]|nr:hypothetical protein [Oscillospiraceae bacterium]
MDAKNLPYSVALLRPSEKIVQNGRKSACNDGVADETIPPDGVRWYAEW